MSLFYDRSISVQNCGKYEWNEADPTIPSAWKSRVVEGKLKRNFFLCPDGSVFACRRSGLHHIINEGFPKEEVEIMRGMLVHEGWKFATFLPTGERISYIYLHCNQIQFEYI